MIKGHFYIQRHHGLDIYMMPVEKQNNGAWKGLSFHDWHGGRHGGKPVLRSFRHIHPVPVVISRENVPAKIVEKFDKRLKEINSG